MIIYIAGPYTLGNTGTNINTALHFADLVVEKGHTPYVPHLSHFWHIVTPRPEEFWLEYDNVFLRKCDALLRLQGKSKGSDAEVELAKSLHLTIYFDVGDIPNVL